MVGRLEHIQVKYEYQGPWVKVILVNSGFLNCWTPFSIVAILWYDYHQGKYSQG